MSAFQKEDKDLFFGREEFVQQLVNAVKQHPLVPVIGASGSGKSSVVLAGLIPRLEAEETWLIKSFRPQSQPFYGLASALVRVRYPELNKNKNKQDEQISNLFERMQGNRKLWQEVTDILNENPGQRLLLVVDQFEELYSLCRDEEERQRFLDQLLSTVDVVSGQRTPNFSLVFTLRADFYGYVLSHRGLVDALRKFTVPPLGPMTPQELQAAIEKPVENLVKLELGLTARILEDLATEPGNLPLLEFALTRLWHTQNNKKLTHTAYQEMGGVKQALAKQAEAIYNKLNWAEQEQVQRIFVQLVRPGEGTEDTRRLATRADVGEENWGLVQDLAGESVRLVVTGRNEATGEETIEVVHEALIREWQSLREWMKIHRIFRTWQERLRAIIQQWEATGEDDGALLRGFSLDEAADWLQRRLADMSVREQKFIRLSLELREKEIKERESQQYRITVARTTAICLGIVGLILIVLLNRLTIIKVFISANKNHLADSNILVNFYLPGVDLSDGNLSKAKLTQADLTKANLSRANLREANLVKTYMPHTILQGTDLSQADLSEADLTGGDLSKAILKGTRLVKTYMPRTILQGTDLSQADLSEADLTGGDLSKAILKGTRFVKTYMPDTILKDADLSGANFEGAYGLNPEKVKSAKNWDQAKYDADFSKKLGLK